MKKLLKVFSALLLSFSLVACNDTMSESDKEAWAEENGYLRSEEDLSAWAEENGYLKGEDLITWAISNGYTKLSDIDFDAWADDNGYLKDESDLDKWADDNGYLKDKSDLNEWAADNGYIKGNSALNAWAKENGYLKSTAELNNWAIANGYIKSEEDLIKWAEDNGYVKQETLAEKVKLEVTFNNYIDIPETTENDKEKNLTTTKYAYLEDKFKSDYSFLLLLGQDYCGTSAYVKSIMAEWVEETKYTVYYISKDDSDYGYGDKDRVMERLGNPTSWPKLYAVIDGEVADIKSFYSSSTTSKEEIKEFIEKYFEIEEFKATTYRFQNLAELRDAVRSGEQFILMLSREFDPDSKNMFDVKRDDTVRKLFKEYDGKLYYIASDDVVAEYANSSLWHDDTKWNGYWGKIDVTNNQSLVTDYNKAETLVYMVASGAINEPNLGLGAEAFLDSAINYADLAYLNDDGTMFMTDSIKSIPGLVAVNFNHSVEYATTEDDVFQLIADNAVMGTKEVNGVTYKTVQQTKNIQVYDSTTNSWKEQEVTYNRLAIKQLNLNPTAGSTLSPFTGDNPVALWIAHKNSFIGALGGKGGATFSTYTNNLTFSNIFTDCLSPRNETYYTEYELGMIQQQTLNWMTSWNYNA